MRRTKKKAARNCEEGGNVDWINDLPDCLICHILYFLPTKDAVATSVLSKRWMHLWTYVPNLDFDFTKFKGRRFRRQRKLERRNFIGPDGHAIPEQYEIKYSYLHYGSIIRNVISHNAVRLDNFRIAYILFDLSDYELEEFLRLAAARGVRNIEITSKYMDKDYFGNKIPESLLNFQHLVSLRLVRCYLDIQPSWSVCLSSLRDLSLEEIEYVDMECFELLIAGCPVLEELTLKQNCGHEYSWCIRSQTLKRLILELFFEEMRSSSFQFIFWGTNTPLLEFFSLQFHAVPDHLSRLPLKFLYNVPTVKWLKVACNFDDFDGGVSNRWGRRSPKRFLNLERLDFSIDWNFLFKLIALADNLKDLILRQVEGKMKLKFPSEVPKCLISHLERLTFVGFEFSDIEFSLLNYLLENALVLKKISMCCHLYKSSSSKLVEKLEGISDKIEVHVHRLDSPPPGSFKCHVFRL